MSELIQRFVEASTGRSRRGFFIESRSWRSDRLLVCFVFAAAGLLTGCGGSTPDPATQSPAAQQPASSTRPVGFAKRVEEKVDESVDLSGVEPDDVFALSPTPPPNFSVVGPAPEARPEDQFFAAIDPAAGTSQFVVTDNSDSTIGSSVSVNSLPSGFTAVAGTLIIDGWPSHIICDADKSEMVLIPEGESVVGALEGPADCVPEVPVGLSAFYISRLEVNVAQFGEFRSRSITAGNLVEKPVNVDSPSDHPALGVAWVEARDYAQATGRALPTECQWEKAARGPKGLSAPWGNGRPLWSSPREPGQIGACGEFPDDRSVYGVLDMAGNAREWLLDFYSETNHEDIAIMDSERRKDWSGPRRASQSGQRVVKGDGPKWAAWFRRGQRMTDRDPNTGFRCVLNLSSSQ